MCHYFCILKKFMPKRVMSRHSNEKFFFHSSEKLRRGNFCVSQNVRKGKLFWIGEGRGGREYKDVLSKVFV